MLDKRASSIPAPRLVKLDFQILQALDVDYATQEPQMICIRSHKARLTPKLVSSQHIQVPLSLLLARDAQAKATLDEATASSRVPDLRVRVAMDNHGCVLAARLLPSPALLGVVSMTSTAKRSAMTLALDSGTLKADNTACNKVDVERKGARSPFTTPLLRKSPPQASDDSVKVRRINTNSDKPGPLSPALFNPLSQAFKYTSPNFRRGNAQSYVKSLLAKAQLSAQFSETGENSKLLADIALLIGSDEQTSVLSSEDSDEEVLVL